jgi:hypothetical protein
MPMKFNIINHSIAKKHCRAQRSALLLAFIASLKDQMLLSSELLESEHDVTELDHAMIY